MRADLAEMGAIVSGSQGQPRVNPLLAALVAHRKLCDQLCVALALPAEGEAVGRRRSAQGKLAADSRWRKTKSGGRVHRIQSMQQKKGA